MDPSRTDAELVRRPVGYWSWATYQAVVSRTRAALAELGTTQPQWWVLAQVARAGTPRTRAEVSGLLREHLDTGPEAMESEIDATITAGWIVQTAPDDRLSLTPEGRTFFERAAAVQDDLWKQHQAGADEEYLTTMQVLQRFIRNTGGRAWHH
ncbi:MarR family winged helix-turn-helix transcriptional regulator [Streptomyces sp. NPDC058737]|uniref:MarR family winged helix-turn-helix transcriptional regulator n=1 Tax=Streptomyces sp. NPDC058737 TaxID=3346617 RepID=UPI0036B8D2F9